MVIRSDLVLTRRLREFRTGNTNNFQENVIINKRAEFYDDFLFDLIDDIEKKDRKINYNDINSKYEGDSRTKNRLICVEKEKQ